MAQHTPMMQQYLSIKAEYPHAFLFFRLGDFYELFFEDAVEAAQILEIALTSRPAGKNGQKIPMCGVPYHTAEQYIKKLIDRGHKVAICEQMEDPKQAKGVVKRQVVRVVTPGTLIEENLLSDHDNHYILFITCADDRYGLLACDLSTGEVLGTAIDDWQLFIEEAARFKPKEVIISPAVSQKGQTDLEQVVPTAHLTVLEKVLQTQQTSPWLSDQLKEIEQTIFHDVLWMMHTYLLDTHKRSINHLKSVTYYEINTYLHLDTQAQRNLELFYTMREQKKAGSLLWVLDQTSTAMGSRLLKKWLTRPLIKREEIEQRLDKVEALYEQPLIREAVQDHLKSVYDLERLTARVAYGNVSPRDLLQLKQSLQIIPNLISELTSITAPSLNTLKEMDPCIELADRLEAALREDAPITYKEGGIFKEGYHPELDELNRASREGKQWMTQLEQQERERTGIKSLKVGYNRVFGYYIEVTKANIHLLDEGIYTRKQTLSNAERFITPELKEKERLILEAAERAVQLEEKLFAELRQWVETYTERLQQLADRVAELDCICALAAVSEEHHYVRPQFSMDGVLQIKEGRHPVVEQVLPAGNYVPNDVLMDDDRRQILLITGPNMAGKSTYMRQVAQIAVMAQIGCFVPAQEATLPIFDQIFTRIGAHDDLVGGHSTFMSEMVETKEALVKATSHSLILLDEIGRGTSTYDGISLAQAVIEYIDQRVRAKTLFSTHYHELTDLEHTLTRLTNVHAACTEENGRVTFLHKILDGKADRSYGIHVADLAGMPQEVICRAQVILEELETKQVRRNDHQVQLSLFGQDELAATQHVDRQIETTQHDHNINHEIMSEIEALDLINMTPLDALNFLFRLQQSLKLKRE